jgi:hypothetical protein
VLRGRPGVICVSISDQNQPPTSVPKLTVNVKLPSELSLGTNAPTAGPTPTKKCGTGWIKRGSDNPVVRPLLLAS